MSQRQLLQVTIIVGLTTGVLAQGQKAPAASPGASKAAPDKKLDVVLKPQTKFFEPEGSIDLHVVLRNTTGAPFDTSPGLSLDEGIVVRDRAGNALPKTGTIEKQGAKLPAQIPPDQPFDRTVDLRLGYPDLAKPGCYRVSWEDPRVRSRAPEIRVAPKYDATKDYLVKLETSAGPITLDLRKDKSPNHVFNFVQLARSGFYDGLTFHRVVDGYLVQGGDPKGDGTGTAGYLVRAEPNDLKHEPGSLVMARSPDDKDSASCQFYICLAPKTEDDRKALAALDGQYTVFGRVVEGMDVVDAIGKVKTGPNDRPAQPIIIKSATCAEKPSSPATAPGKP